IYHVVRAQQTPPKVDPLVEPASSPYSQTLAGTGLVESDTENIAIGSHHSGVVGEVLVKVGDKVAKGKTPLFRLDDRQLLAELDMRKANLKSAQAQLSKLRALPRTEEVPPAAARLKEAEANLTDQTDQYDRYARLENSGSINEFELIRRRQAM